MKCGVLISFYLRLLHKDIINKVNTLIRIYNQIYDLVYNEVVSEVLAYVVKIKYLCDCLIDMLLCLSDITYTNKCGKIKYILDKDKAVFVIFTFFFIL